MVTESNSDIRVENEDDVSQRFASARSRRRPRVQTDALGHDGEVYYLSEEEDESMCRWFPICLMLISFCGGGIYGMNVASSAYLEEVKDKFGLGSVGESIISSAATVTDAVAMLVAGLVLLDRWGRRLTVVLGAALSVAGCLLGAAVNSFLWLVVARLVQGVGNGVSILSVPMLVSETAPAKRRGLFVSMFQVGVVFGFAMPFPVQIAFSTWQITVAAGALPGAMLLCFLVSIWSRAESRSWLAAQAVDRRRASTAQEGTNGDNESGMTTSSDRGGGQQLAIGVEHENDDDDASNTDEEVPLVSFRTSVLLTIVLAFTNNSSDAIIFYGPNIIEQAHIGHEKSLWTAFGISLVNIPAVVIALAIIHKVSRRTMLLCGLGVVIFTYIALGFCYMGGAKNHHILVILMVVVLMIAYQIGPGTLFVVVLPELFTQRRRAQGMTVGTVAMSTFSIICNGTLLVTMDAFGTGPTFLLYGVLYLVCFVLLGFFLPETRGVKIAPDSTIH